MNVFLRQEVLADIESSFTQTLGRQQKKICLELSSCRRPIEKCLEFISEDSPEIQKMRRFQKTSIQCHFISKIPQFRGQVYSILSFSDNVQALY